MSESEAKAEEESGQEATAEAGQGQQPTTKKKFVPGPPKQPRPMDPVVVQMMSEKEMVDPALVAVHKVLQDEIDRRSFKSEPEYIEVDIPKKIKVSKKVLIPAHRNPEFNYVGKLMGPGGSTMKKMQEKFACKIFVLGHGSSKDIFNEHKLLESGDPRYSHFGEDLHVKIDVIATPADAFRKVADIFDELKTHFNATMDDDISKSQIAELGFNPNEAGRGKPTYASPSFRGSARFRGGGRGAGYASQPYGGGYGRGAPTGHYAPPASSYPPPPGPAHGYSHAPPAHNPAVPYYDESMNGQEYDYGGKVAEPMEYSGGDEYYSNGSGAAHNPYAPVQHPGSYAPRPVSSAAGSYGRIYGSAPPPSASTVAPTTGKYPPPVPTTRGTFRAHPYGTPRPPAPVTPRGGAASFSAGPRYPASGY